MRIESSSVAALGGKDAVTLRVEAFRRALDEHRFTVGVPAPAEDPLIDAIGRSGGMEAVEILDTADTPSAAPRTLSAFAFRRRFTQAERAAITLAASQALDAGDATLQVWLDDLNSTQFVELDNPELAAGLALLVEHKLIDAARVAEVLA
jgi:hypothetical protein